MVKPGGLEIQGCSSPNFSASHGNLQKLGPDGHTPHSSSSVSTALQRVGTRYYTPGWFSRLCPTHMFGEHPKKSSRFFLTPVSTFAHSCSLSAWIRSRKGNGPSCKNDFQVGVNIFVGTTLSNGLRQISLQIMPTKGSPIKFHTHITSR